MCNILKQIFLIYLKQFRLTIYLIIGIFLFFCLFLAYDVRFMSDKEVLACLTRIYDREFIVQSTHRLNEAERAENVWRVKVYDVVPADEPERHFWAFNIVKAESGGIFAASDGLRDTLSAEIMLATFAERAAQSGLAYELTYDSYPCQASTGYYSGISVNIERCMNWSQRLPGTHWRSCLWVTTMLLDWILCSFIGSRTGRKINFIRYG